MIEKISNFAYSKDGDDKHPIIFAIRNRMVVDHEDWVLAALSNEEVKQLYEFLGDYLESIK